MNVKSSAYKSFCCSIHHLLNVISCCSWLDNDKGLLKLTACHWQESPSTAIRACWPGHVSRTPSGACWKESNQNSRCCMPSAAYELHVITKVCSCIRILTQKKSSKLPVYHVEKSGSCSTCLPVLPCGTLFNKVFNNMFVTSTKFVEVTNILPVGPNLALPWTLVVRRLSEKP